MLIDPALSSRPLRLFTAIDLPPEIGAELEAPLRELPSPRPVSVDRLHLTLNFLGSVESRLADKLKDELLKVDARAFSLRFQGAGCFPSEARPRVLWLGVEASEPLQELKRKLDRALSELGFPLETRPFHPHWTLMRIRDARKVSLAKDWLESFRDFRSREFRIDRFHLYSSHLEPSGSKYRRELTVGLA